MSADEFVQDVIRGVEIPGTGHVVTANAQYYVLAQRDACFRACVGGAEYVCADGMPIVFASRLLAGRRVERLTGVDLVPKLCAEAAAKGLTVYFLGGKPGMAEKTAAKLVGQFPLLRVAGTACPPIGFTQDPYQLDKTLALVREANPAITFVALGVPLQDYFIESYLRPMGVPVAVGVGGSFEMIAGAVRRAPRWVQYCGFEWLFRWLQEPLRLWNRYFVGNTLFCYYLAKDLFSRDEVNHFPIGESPTAEQGAE